MQPIGLTLKNVKSNPFTGRTSGEPMIVHLCLTCGAVSKNRVAGDDMPHALIALLDKAVILDRETTDKLRRSGIQLLTSEDKPLVMPALFGYAYLEQIE